VTGPGDGPPHIWHHTGMEQPPAGRRWEIDAAHADALHSVLSGEPLEDWAARRAATTTSTDRGVSAVSDKVVPHAAGEVEVGWTLRYDGADRQVVRVWHGPPKPGEIDRQVRLWFAGDPQPLPGDEGQTVYVVAGARSSAGEPPT
jgi:hypothetical protein